MGETWRQPSPIPPKYTLAHGPHTPPVPPIALPQSCSPTTCKGRLHLVIVSERRKAQYRARLIFKDELSELSFMNKTIKFPLTIIFIMVYSQTFKTIKCPCLIHYNISLKVHQNSRQVEEVSPATADAMNDEAPLTYVGYWLVLVLRAVGEGHCNIGCKRSM